MKKLVVILAILSLFACDQNVLTNLEPVHSIKIVTLPGSKSPEIAPQNFNYGGKYALHAIALDINGNYLTDLKVDWSVTNQLGEFSDPQNASSTVFTALNIGEEQITASHKYIGKTASALFSVSSTTPTATTLSTLPSPDINSRYDHAAVAVNKKLFLFGGYYSQGNSATIAYEYPVVSYDFLNGSWDTPIPLAKVPGTLAPFSWISKPYFGFIGLSAVNIGEKVYIFGGTANEIFTEHYSNKFFIFDPVTTSFSEVQGDKDRPSPRAWHSAHVIDDNIYIFGGRVGFNRDKKVFNELHMYKSGKNTWSRIRAANAPSARYYHASATYESKIFILFGKSATESNVDTSLHVFDSKTRHWTQIPSSPDSPPQNREGMTLTRLGVRLYAFGGKDIGSNNHYGNIFYIFNLKTMKWEAPSTGHSVPNKRAGHTTTSYRGMLYIFGGSEANTTTNSLYSFLP